MHTSVALERKDFNSFDVQEGLHIGIIVKDFRSVVALADSLRTMITAKYSRGNRPLQFVFDIEGMTCEFTLMTRGHSEAADNASTAGTPARDLSIRPLTRPSQPVRSAGRTAQSMTPMPPPPARVPQAKPTATARNTIAPSNAPTLQPVPSATFDDDGLFIAADDDQAWDEPDYAAEEDDVGWDASINPVSCNSSKVARWPLTNCSQDSFASDPSRRLRDGVFSQAQPSRQVVEHPGIEPTQRLSEVRHILDW